MKKLEYEKVLEKIKPDPNEYRTVNKLADELISIIKKIASDNNINAEAVLVGSVAKDTWLSGKADIDIFIKFPLSTDETDLKEKGLFLGHKCIEILNGDYELRYASHPYVTGLIDGFEIDFVPCYSIENADELKSAVDRTILHTLYVKSNLLNSQKNDVILLKKFMESINTYGSEFKVGGFAGYLCELLVLYYGSFNAVLRAAGDKWCPGYVIDMEEYGTGKYFTEPLVVIDPVDKNRNVAAALTKQKMAEFVVASRNFIEKPELEYFQPKIIETDQDKIMNEFVKRGTRTILLTFRPPSVPADAVYPQLKKTENSLKKIAQREEFNVYGSDSWTDETRIAIILLEMCVWELPSIRKHLGPYVWNKSHQEKFLEKYGHHAWINNDQWVVNVEREYIDIGSMFKDLLSAEKINYLKLGKHVKKEIIKNVEIIDVKKFLKSEECNDEVIDFLFNYLNKSHNIWR
ncbi:MAG: CCA tRNA nucleotidyltransferase [Methanomicrobiales archaeon]